MQYLSNDHEFKINSQTIPIIKKSDMDFEDQLKIAEKATNDLFYDKIIMTTYD